MLQRIFLLFFLFPLAASAQSDDVYAVTNFALEHAKIEKGFYLRDSALVHVYYDSESDSMLINDLKEELTPAERSSMLAQLASLKGMTWDTTKLHVKPQLVSAKELNKMFAGRKIEKNWKKYFKSHTAGYYEISQPVFTADHKKAIVYVAQRCGAGCGFGGATLFAQNADGKWTVVRNLFAWTN